MNYLKIENPKWLNTEKTRLDCEVTFEIDKDVFELLHFTADIHDTEQHGKEIFEAASKMNVTPFNGIITKIVPQTISRRQLLIGLTLDGYISSAEGIAAASVGTVPTILQNIINTLDTDSRIAAQITWASMTDASINDSLLNAALVSLGKTKTDLDDFFIKYSKI